jgi:MFS family permease
VLGALRHRNYQLFFGGQVVSTIGTWMQNVAQPWLVLQITHSGFWVGLIIATQFLPVLLFGPVGGLIADRFPKRLVLILTQTAYMLPAFALFLVTHAGVVQLWMVFGAAVAIGLVNVFDPPTRQAFIIEMVGREDLPNAIALNSSVFNTSSVVGPSIAGILISTVGLPICYLVNGVSFIAVIGALALMRDLPRLHRDRPREPLMVQLREGFSYAKNNPAVGMLLIMVAVVSLFAMNRLTLLPLFADSVLHIGARGFGFLVASLGVGAVTGAVALAVLPHGAITPRRQFIAVIVWVAALIGFSLSRAVWLSVSMLFVVGLCQMWFLISANTRVQSMTPEHLRGRVMSLYMQSVMGVSPIGSAQAGALASAFGPPAAMITGAVIVGLVALYMRIARPAVFT